MTVRMNLEIRTSMCVLPKQLVDVNKGRSKFDFRYDSSSQMPSLFYPCFGNANVQH